jgi:hypothetical protein
MPVIDRHDYSGACQISPFVRRPFLHSSNHFGPVLKWYYSENLREPQAARGRLAIEHDELTRGKSPPSEPVTHRSSINTFLLSLCNSYGLVRSFLHII